MNPFALVAALIVAPPGHPPFADLPRREYVQSFRQIGRMRSGRLTIQVAVQNPTRKSIVVGEGELAPWACNGTMHFHYAVFVGRKGQALPNEKFSAFCYEKPITLAPGEVYTSQVTLDGKDVPAFRNAEPGKDLIEFVWTSRHPHGGGGVVDIE